MMDYREAEDAKELFGCCENMEKRIAQLEAENKKIREQLATELVYGPTSQDETVIEWATEGVKQIIAERDRYKEALLEFAGMPDEYVSGVYAKEWLQTNPPKHAVVHTLRQKARIAIGWKA